MCGSSNLSTDPKSPKCIYNISKNFRVEKNGEISRNLRFSLVFVPASKSDTHHGWGSRIQDLNLRPFIKAFRAASAQIPANASVCIAPNIQRTNKKAERHKCHSAFLAGVAGFGPTNARVKVWCLTAWLYPNIIIISFQRSNYTISFTICQVFSLPVFIFYSFFLPT